MNRRQFQLAALLAASGSVPASAQPSRADRDERVWLDIEASSGGRMGVAVLPASGSPEGQRLDERFPMCSTFKWLAAAFVLRRVDAGRERLDRRIAIERRALLPNSPVTTRHVGAAGMTLGELCHATITVSDNTAANLILATFGGPEALTRYLRDLGDEVTRVDRWETELNEALPGDPRDTTTPRAMAGLLRKVVLGDALSPRSRLVLTRWLEASRTDGTRLRAGLPPGWRLGSKTGTGGRGSTNDVGVFWPPGRAPVVVAVYLTDSDADAAARTGAIAAVGRRITARP